MASPARQNRSSDGYFYSPEAYMHTQRRPAHPPPPPLPPKELDAGYVTKETHHGFAAELEGDSDMGYEKTAGPSSHKKQKEKSKQRVASKPKRKLRVLSLDGGGIRGYSTLVILGELMHQIFLLTNNGKGPISPSELPRPCDYFDLIGGTGTGGLIALMLGRMRMDVESCKEYYVSLTRYVFITDKTLMGVPYGKTLFKASRLEEAIRHCVSESTRFETAEIIPHSPPPKSDSPKRVEHRRSSSWRNSISNPVRRRASSLDREESRGRRRRHSACNSNRTREGNADAPLLDSRPGACKTFVTAVYKGTPPNSTNPPALLRTYPSRAESTPSYNMTIWQAGRATSATLSAFKPMTIGQNTFLDEGSGRYNPAAQVLHEAHTNEFPDDAIGVFISIGTGKRPDTPPTTTPQPRHHHHGWWEGIIAEEFTEARRRLMSKLDDCERVHRALIDPEDGGRPGLAKMGVAREDYYRFNVEVGVGEFALNEWNRLPEVSTNTRRYIAQRETGGLVKESAAKLVDIERRRRQPGGGDIPRPVVGVTVSAPIVPMSPPPPVGFAELAGEEKETEKQWEAHPSMRPFSPIEQVVTYPPKQPEQQQQPPPVLPPKPVKPQRESRPLYQDNGAPGYGDAGYYGGGPNPEIRVTSPTTVAGDSDDEGRRRIATGRQRRRSGSTGGGRRR